MEETNEPTRDGVPDSVRRALEDRYEIETLVGRGAMGAVYRARDIRLDLRVGIKVLEAGALNSDAQERFLREGRLMASLSHPNILRIHDVGASDGMVFQVREWIEGASLGRILEVQGRLELRDALIVARAIARALEAAHEHDVLHRDVKPSNVLVPVASGGQKDYLKARLADFGVHGEIDRLTGVTRVGQFFGTPFYMAPEQITAGAQSPATDVWGLGALLFEVLVGRRPFEASNLVELFRAVIEEPLHFPPDPHLPAAVERFVSRCLEKDPELRPPKPSANLQGLLSGEGGPLVSMAVEEDPVLGPGDLTRRLRSPHSSGPGDLPRPLSAPDAQRGQPVLLPVVLTATGVAAVSVVLYSGMAWMPSTAAFDFLLGITLLSIGVGMGVAAHRWLGRQGAGVRNQDGPVMAMGSSRAELGETMAVLVDDLIAECRKVDEKMLGMSVAFMVDQVQRVDSFSERKDALFAAMELMERLRDLRTPWWVRHDKLIALAVSMAGILTGVLKIVEAFRGS